MNKALTKILTAGDGRMLDNGSPEAQNAGIGERMAFDEGYSLQAIDVNIDAAANSTAKSFTVPFDCTIKDVFARATASSSSGTATLRRSTTAITSAIVMAVDTTLARTATLVAAQLACTAGETLNLITNGANDRGVVTLLVVRQ